MLVPATKMEAGKVYRLGESPYATTLGIVLHVVKLIPRSGTGLLDMGPSARIREVSSGYNSRDVWWQFDTDIFEELTDEEATAYRLSTPQGAY